MFRIKYSSKGGDFIVLFRYIRGSMFEAVPVRYLAINEEFSVSGMGDTGITARGACVL